MTCKICNENFTTMQGISAHIKRVHKIESQTYYDKYFKAPNEGVCSICGKPTRYIGLSQGYMRCCNDCKTVKGLQTRQRVCTKYTTGENKK